MIVIKTGDGKAEIIRNKRKGLKLIVKKVNPESTKNCCIWCSLRFSSICFPPNNPCDLFLPNPVFFEDDAKNNT
jgi:hypothetical protein